MNLLLIDSIDIPFGGAHSAHVVLLIKGLRKNGQNAILIIPYGSKREILLPGTKTYGHYEDVPYKIICHKKNTNGFFNYVFRVFGVLKTSFLLSKRKNKKKLDGVILGGPDIVRDFPLVIVCLFLRIPLYLWHVEKMSLCEDYHGISGFFNYHNQVLSERILPRFSKGIIVISSFLKRHFLNYVPEEKILINPILVYPEMYHSNYTNYNFENFQKIKNLIKENKLLVYSGSFAEKDGIHYLIDAFNEVSKKYDNVLLVMTGKNANNTLMQRVRDHIIKLKLEKRIKLTGFVNSDELFTYNHMADILIAIRSDSPFANHGFPWKLGEYCMTGKPVIASAVSDILQYFKDNQNLFIVEPNSSEAIANKILYILDNYDNALEVAKNGKATAIKYFGYIEKTNEIIEFIERTEKLNKTRLAERFVC